MNKSNIWFRFSKFINNGKKINFRWEKLPGYRFEEFVDFKMNNYVRHEFTHLMAGIPRNPKAMAEYRDILTKLYKHPSYQTNICCVDDETHKMVGFDSLKLFRKGETYYDFWPAETAEVKLFYKIIECLDKLCPVPDIMMKFGVNQFFDDAGLAIHPNYRGLKFTAEVALLRHMVSKANGVPLTGAWMSSSAVQQRTRIDEWDKIYEISSEQLEKKIGIKTQSRSQMYAYKVKRIV